MNHGKKIKTTATRMRTLVKARASEEGIIWVNGHRVNMLTGWDKRELEYLREEGNIRFKQEGKLIRYDLDSIHKVWETIKKFKIA